MVVKKWQTCMNFDKCMLKINQTKCNVPVFEKVLFNWDYYICVCIEWPSDIVFFFYNKVKKKQYEKLL